MKNFINQNKLKIIKCSIYFTFLLDIKGYSETNYLPPDPFLIVGDNNDTTTSEEISKKISQLQDQNKEMRAKILSLQDLLVSRFKDRIELKVEVVSNQEKELPQFGFIELSAIMNNISIINYSKPVFFEKKMHLPIFSGPLPIGTYEVKIHAIVGQQTNNWPYTLPQGKWSVDKKIVIDGSMGSPIHNIKLYLKQNKETSIPEFESEINEIKENN
jgi:hypothetical protein